MTRLCTRCGKDISHKHPNAKFCDKKCKDGYWNALDKDGVERRFWKNKKTPKPTKTVKCEYCGKETPERDICETDLQDRVCPDCYHNDLDCGDYICEQY